MALGSALPVVLRVQEIDAPLDASDRSKPVEVRAVVSLSEEVRRREDRPQLRSGMSIVCPVLPEGRSTIAVPQSAVVQQSGALPVVGVLQSTSGAATGASADASLQSSAGARTFRLEWRPVALGSQVQDRRKIVGGLMPGESIVLQAQEWRRWSQVNGPNAVVHVAPQQA